MCVCAGIIRGQTWKLEEVVKDDLMVLESGNQICNDAVVVDGMLEVNESLLTGESDAVLKETGGNLLSGSSVISGKALARVIHVEMKTMPRSLPMKLRGKSGYSQNFSDL